MTLQEVQTALNKFISPERREEIIQLVSKQIEDPNCKDLREWSKILLRLFEHEKRNAHIGMQFYTEVEYTLGDLLYGRTEHHGVMLPCWGDHTAPSLLDEATSILKETDTVKMRIQQRKIKAATVGRKTT